MTVKGAKALELWCRRATEGYPGVDVSNMTSAWRDGLAFCALIHRFRPDLIDFARLNRKDVRGNNALAFKIAEEHLSIPNLLDPEDMILCDIPDRLSVLTYVSEFYHKFKNCQPRGSPMEARLSIPLSRTSSSSSSGVGSSCSSSVGSDSPPPAPPQGAIRSLMDQPVAAAVMDPNPVVARRHKEPSQQARLAARRMVKSMYVESARYLPSKADDNPFRKMLHINIEKENQEPRHQSTTRWRVERTEGPFKSCLLQKQMSCPAASTRASNPSLSFTSTPRPYDNSLLRSGSIGQSLNQSAMTTRHIDVKRRSQSASRKPRPLSMLSPSSGGTTAWDHYKSSPSVCDEGEPVYAPSMIQESYKGTLAPTFVPKRERHLIGMYNQDKLKLQIEGRASLV